MVFRVRLATFGMTALWYRRALLFPPSGFMWGPAHIDRGGGVTGATVALGGYHVVFGDGLDQVLRSACRAVSTLLIGDLARYC